MSDNVRVLALNDLRQAQASMSIIIKSLTKRLDDIPQSWYKTTIEAMSVSVESLENLRKTEHV